MAELSLDAARLGEYLGAHIDNFGTVQGVEKFAGGQSNPTYLLTTSTGGYVLRSKPPGQLLKSAHAVDREFRVIKSLAETDVPVAPALHLCEDESVTGSMFYVMGYVEGRIFWDPSLPEVERADRAAYHEEIVRTLSAIHDVDLQAAALEDYGRPGNYFDRQIGRWTKQYQASETSCIEPMEALMAWLPANAPAEDGETCLIHGDFRIDNLIFDPAAPRVLAVLDWELSTLGHPLADLAYLCMCMRLPDQGDVRGLGNKDRAALGVPEEAQIVEQYCRLRNIPAIDNWPFYLAFSFFRMASICQGVYKRALDGNASNKKAMQIGALVAPLAEAGLALVR
ncbi:MAG: phosphotransferase family protein [Gammaproteobacteria bacterium]|nr:phosphotransferase family protein [Gammaproteobacteria bacterium]